jgi:hypothetical protein
MVYVFVLKIRKGPGNPGPLKHEYLNEWLYFFYLAVTGAGGGAGTGSRNGYNRHFYGLFKAGSAPYMVECHLAKIFIALAGDAIPATAAIKIGGDFGGCLGKSDP